jgi:hypothetical protein
VRSCAVVSTWRVIGSVPQVRRRRKPAPSRGGDQRIRRLGPAHGHAEAREVHRPTVARCGRPCLSSATVHAARGDLPAIFAAPLRCRPDGTPS